MRLVSVAGSGNAVPLVPYPTGKEASDDISEVGFVQQIGHSTLIGSHSFKHVRLIIDFRRALCAG